jgi:hypothetical protein
MTRTVRSAIAVVVLLLALAAIVAVAWLRYHQPSPGHVLDEALAAGRTAESFPAADEDYFHDMDDGTALNTAEVRGRNTWIVWTGGNDWFWNEMTLKSAGAVDFLKVVSSHDGLKGRRSNRWQYFGLVNEPCFDEPAKGDPNRWGLWLDVRRADCPPDPFENETKYPGVKTGARGTTVAGHLVPLGSFYGYATGIVGLRLYSNPAFDDKAAAKWDAEKYYKCSTPTAAKQNSCSEADANYFGGKDLIRPYRVGMSCAFCHVGPNPVHPPKDPNNPQWADLSSNVGAQYFWVDRIFYPEADDTNFAFQLFHASRPGTLDTSFISTDNINNPRTMNAVYYLLPRLLEAKRWGKETLAGGGLDNHQFNDYLPGGPLADLYQAPDTVWTPRVLKDGADSVGAMGALNRVYLNIGTFGEEWLQHFNALVGGKPVTPITIKVARTNSASFKATEAQTFDTAQFFLKTTEPHKLAKALSQARPEYAGYLTKDQKVLTRGKEVFADTCARCHSSKRPDPPVPGLDPEGCNGKNYLQCWNSYWNWTKSSEFKQKMRAIVLADDFLTDNYLSAEFRVPVTLLQTNACSPLATNAIGGNIWDNFSSQSYKDLPSVGSITWYDPYTGEPRSYTMPAGGRGYTRPPSLVSIWSTAPFLLNNTLGPFEPSPSVEARLASFEKSIEQLLWPERRDKDSVLGNRIPGLIDRVGDRLEPGHASQPVYLKVSEGFLPDFMQHGLRVGQVLLPWLFGGSGIQIGPIPPGTPIGLLSNVNPLLEDPDPAKRLAYQTKVARLVERAASDLKALGPNASPERARDAFRNLVQPLLELSKCPDLIVNRGHYFGTSYFKEEPGLSDQDKAALIEFLKTF